MSFLQDLLQGAIADMDPRAPYANTNSSESSYTAPSSLVTGDSSCEASAFSPQILELNAKLSSLDFELSEGDITEKGYKKRRAQLLEEYGVSMDGEITNTPVLGADDGFQNKQLASVASMASVSSLPFPARPEFSETRSSSSAGLGTVESIIRHEYEFEDQQNESAAPDSNYMFSLYGNEETHQASSYGYPQDLVLQMPLDPRATSEANFDPQNGKSAMAKFDNLAAILRHRGRSNARTNAIVTLDAKGKEFSAITWDKLASRAEKVGQVIRDKSGLYRGDRVALLYRESEVVDFAVALLGCFLAGVVAVPINTITKFKDITYILNYTQSHLALTTDANLKTFHRDFTAAGLSWPRGVEWWKTNEFGSYHPPSKKADLPALQVPDLAYIEYSRAPTGELRGVVMSHKTMMHQMSCLSSILSSKDKRSASSSNSITRSQNVLSYLDPRQSIGMIMGVLMTIYAGNTMTWVPQSTLAVPGLYANVISKFKPSILLADYPGLKQVAYNYQSYPLATRNYSKKHPVDLSSIKWCLIDCLTVDTEFHEILADRWFKPLGNKRYQTLVVPMLTLSEHGGMVISMRDWIGGQEALGCQMPDEMEPADAFELSELLLDKKALSANKVTILSTRPHKDGFFNDYNPQDIIRIGAFGYPLPDATLAIVDPETCILVPELVVGEIWVDSPCLSGGFWGLGRETEIIFHARCWGNEGTLEMEFLRTGLLGFIYAGKVYILGLYEDRLRQRREVDEDQNSTTNRTGMVYEGQRNYRYHYTAHLVQTIMQTIPRVFDSCAFDIFVNDEHLPVILLESALAVTTPETPTGPPRTIDIDALEAMAEKCMVILRERHNVRIYCVLITAPNTLPRTIRNGRSEIGAMLCRKDFETGILPCVHVKFGVDHAVNNLAVDQAVEDHGGIWSVASSRMRDELLVNDDKQYSGIDDRDVVMDDRTGRELSNFTSIVDILQYRVVCQPEELSFCTIDARSRENKGMSWKKFDARIAAVGSTMINKYRLRAGDVVILIYTHGEDFVHAVHACLTLGIIAIPIPPLDNSRLSEDVPALLGLVKDYKPKAILLNAETDHAIKSKAIAQQIKQTCHAAKLTMPPTYNTMKTSKVSGGCKDLKFKMNPAWIAPGRTALVWVHWTADQRRVAVKLSHATILEMCKVQKETCQMQSSKPVVGCVRSSVGIGFLHTCFMGIYVGASTYLISPVDFAANPQLYFLSLARYKVKDTYVTPQMIDHALTSTPMKSNSLRDMRNLMIAFDGRPRTELFGKVRVHFSSGGLDGTAINSIYSHALNPMITTRSYMCIEPIELKLDLRELRRGFIAVAPPDSKRHTLTIQDSGMVPVSTHVLVVHPETRRLCRSSEYGEIWVSSGANVDGIYESKDPFDQMRFSSTTVEADAGLDAYSERNLKYVRTGDLGFLRTVAQPVGPGGAMVDIQVLFVLGCIGDTFEVRGLSHFAHDIERTIEYSHRTIPLGCSAVFQTGGVVVAVVESSRQKQFLASLVPVVVNAVMNEHQMVLDVVAFVAKGEFPRSRLAEKQRGKIMAAWVMRKLRTTAQFTVSSSTELQARIAAANAATQ
ncbi:hypothetical protein BZA70DRAFT_244673 [Myxozyma melibiosi]|uniref:DMAP1-binding domain-containing protein n=1 Tax=Myxozyma melibiosi TaxID=54550 RepID=A0ABR1FE63_9ASCO